MKFAIFKEITMIAELKYPVETMEIEFNGSSFNGTSIIKTLEELGFADIINKENKDKMSPWMVFQHTIFCKYVTLEVLLKPKKLDSLPFEYTDYPDQPENPDEQQWKTIITYGKQIHSELIEVLKNVKQEVLGKKIDMWDCTISDIMEWLPTHDTYHNAHIRNVDSV